MRIELDTALSHAAAVKVASQRTETEQMLVVLSDALDKSEEACAAWKQQAVEYAQEIDTRPDLTRMAELRHDLSRKESLFQTALGKIGSLEVTLALLIDACLAEGHVHEDGGCAICKVLSTIERPEERKT